MFTKRAKPPAVGLHKLTSLIAQDVLIVGDLVFADGVRLDGCVRGSVIGRAPQGGAAPLLVLSHQGRVEGSIHCGEALIDGTVTGDLTVDDFLDLQANARVCGTIRYRRLRMHEGAVVLGQLVHAGAADAADAAPAAVAAAAAEPVVAGAERG